MKDKNEKIKYYLEIIDEIEKVRSSNNMNWMDLLRLAFKHAPEESKKLMKKIDHEDNRVSELVKKLVYFCVAVTAWMVVIKPDSIPKVSFKTS